MKKLVLAALAACMAGNLYAAGFRMSEQSASANGMGNAFVAVADDASAVWYNPAAMVNLEKTNLSLGSAMVFSQMTHKNTDATIQRNELSPVSRIDKTAMTSSPLPHFYATHRLNEKWAVGMGANVPFGLSTSWDDTQAQTRGIATYSTLHAMNYNLNAAYKATDKLSVGLGFDYYAIQAEMDKWYTGSGTDAEQVLKGEGKATGYNLAAMYKHDDKLTFGASYRSSARAKIKGSIYHPILGNVAVQAAQSNATVGGTYYYGDANTKVHLPDTFQVGAAYQYNDKWQFTSVADWTNWATYHKLLIKWYGDMASTTEHKSWKSVWAYRLGTQYKYSDALKFRAGTYYDNTPVPDSHFETRLPDSDRIGASLGAGWTKGSFTVDISYLYVMFKDRNVTNSMGGSTNNNASEDVSGVTNRNHLLDGKYSASAHLPAVTVGYKF